MINIIISNPQVQKSYPYLTPACFPHNWAIADMVKGYIAGTQKEHNHQACEDKGQCEAVRLKKHPAHSDVDDLSEIDD